MINILMLAGSALLGASVAFGSLLPEARLVRGLRPGVRMTGVALIALTKNSWLLLPYACGFLLGAVAIYFTSAKNERPSDSPE